jgi:hypothetical protein
MAAAGNPGAMQARPEAPTARQTTTGRRTSKKAIAALVLPIVGIIVLGVVLGPAGAILGGLAVRDTNRDPSLGGRGLAIAGIILGVIVFVLSALGAAILLSHHH